jgi:coatomer subunit gamma
LWISLSGFTPHRFLGPSSLDTIGAPVARTTTPAPAPQTAEETQSSFVQQLAQVPELASYGTIINTSKPVQLTENETEYQVSCVKHIFREHIVFQVCVPRAPLSDTLGAEIPQFNVSNTMSDTTLEQVSVIMQPPDDSGLTEDFIIPIPVLSSASSPSVVYVSFTRDSPDEYATASFPCLLKFISKEVDPATGEPEAEGYEDEYQLEEVELAAGGDYIIPSYSNFSSEWDRLRTGASITETFTLSSMESIKGLLWSFRRFSYTHAHC